jgi:hypothetical protein
VVPKLADLD